MRAKHIQSKRGFTLTELAIVLGVIGIVIGAIWYAASNVHEAQKDNDAVVEIQTVAQNIATLMTGQKFQTATNITSSMIAAQTIPSSYIDAVTPTTADTPWSSGNFVVYAMSATKFRLSFYQVTYKGCLALVTQLTNCQTGQTTCPVQAYANDAANQLYLPTGTLGVTLPANTSWTGIATTTNINTLCGTNSYTGGVNSVEFDFSL